MISSRKISIAVGVLYILGTVFGIGSVVFTGSIMAAPEYLRAIFENQNKVKIGALFILLMGISLAFIPILLYPLLKKFSGFLALAYVVFRGALETVTCFISATGFFLLLVLSRTIGASGMDFNSYSVLAETVKGLTDVPIMVFVFSIDAFILYFILFQSRLIPRWLSGFGIVAILLHFTTGILILFDLQSAFSTSNLVMNFPIFIQEMIMAVWFIAKGFDTEKVKI